MILEITDLGAIKKMELDLSKNFILFCGPNSTGKTYASYILNAFLSNRAIDKLSYFDSVIHDIIHTGSFKIKKEYIDEWFQNVCNGIKNQLGNIFGVSEESKNLLFDKFNLNVKYDDSDYKSAIEQSLFLPLTDGEHLVNVTKDNDSDIVKFDYLLGDLSNFLDSTALYSLVFLNKVISCIALPKYESVRMLTVERNSIYTFKTELSLSRNALIDRIQQKNAVSDNEIIHLVNKSSRRYPLAVNNSLRIANDLENIQKETGDYTKIADEIENGLLHGKVSMTKGGDVEFSVQSMSESKKIPFHLSSSIVKTMASLVIYLRHIAMEGDTIIVDEPEMNFHPDVQVLLSQIFAKLSNNGLHVVISTHSDYIIREVNNMIMAGALYNKGKAEKADECGYSKDCSLDKNSVEVIYFNPDHETGYVETQSLPIDDEGFAVSSIDKTIIEQNQRTESLYDSLYE